MQPRVCARAQRGERAWAQVRPTNAVRTAAGLSANLAWTRNRCTCVFIFSKDRKRNQIVSVENGDCTH
jgi:hypothetical protein